jgi:hypothetical protein
MWGARISRVSNDAVADEVWSQDSERLEQLARNVPGVGAENTADEVERAVNEDVRRNRRRVAIAAGALAVGTIGGNVLGHALGLHGGSGHDHTPGANHDQHPNSGKAAPGTKPAASGHPNPADQKPGSSGPEEYRIKDLELTHNGDNLWDEVDSHLSHVGIHDPAKVAEAKNMILKANGLSEEDARHLPIGFKFNLPPDVLEELNKQ